VNLCQAIFSKPGTIINYLKAEAIEKAREQLANEPNLSSALNTTFDLLIELCLLLARKWIPKNSSNSSIPPSADPNREKTSRAEGKQKPGGKAGHPGAALKPVDTPDKTVPFTIDRRTLPEGKGKSAGWERRQEEVREAYRRLLRKGDKECPKPEAKPPGK
jgi:transposase